MNGYVVYIPELRSEIPSMASLEPPESWYPADIFAAETPGQAKSDALREWTSGLRSGVYSDDWPSLRVRLLERNVPLKRGRVTLDVGRGGTKPDERVYNNLWWRASGILIQVMPNSCERGAA